MAGEDGIKRYDGGSIFPAQVTVNLRGPLRSWRLRDQDQQKDAIPAILS
jgi:hypothetical protein